MNLYQQSGSSNLKIRSGGGFLIYSAGQGLRYSTRECLWTCTVFSLHQPDSVANCIKIFADEVYSAISTTCDKDCDELQDDLSELSVWSDLLELCFNAKKCKSLHIGRNNPRQKSGSKFRAFELFDSEKGLGVIFESTLRFDNQILNCVNKANKMLRLVNRTYTPLPPSPPPAPPPPHTHRPAPV